jgi:predicted MPP superfamily phosphohydrolase
MRQLAVFVCLSIISQTSWAAPNLQFRANGEFKILQFTDLHYIYDDPKAEVALQCIDELIQSEKPDLVVSTGDNVWGRPGLPAMQRIVDHIDKFKVPFVILFGNHDSHEAA